MSDPMHFSVQQLTFVIFNQTPSKNIQPYSLQRHKTYVIPAQFGSIVWNEVSTTLVPTMVERRDHHCTWTVDLKQGKIRMRRLEQRKRANLTILVSALLLHDSKKILECGPVSSRSSNRSSLSLVELIQEVVSESDEFTCRRENTNAETNAKMIPLTTSWELNMSVPSTSIGVEEMMLAQASPRHLSIPWPPVYENRWRLPVSTT